MTPNETLSQPAHQFRDIECLVMLSLWNNQSVSLPFLR